MNNEGGLPARTSGVLADISQNLGGVFRHMLPGVLVVGAARVAHPSWFRGFNFYSWQHLVALAVLTVAVGNAWFAFNRYVLVQLWDYLLYRMGCRGPAKTAPDSKYLNDLGMHIHSSVHTPEADVRAQQHVAFRASTVLLILTVGELAIAASCPGNDSLLYGYKWHLFVGGLLALAVGLWQMVITRRIDYDMVNPADPHRGASHSNASSEQSP